MLLDCDLAYLGMYDLPALRPAQDAWWKGLAEHFAAHGLSSVPTHLVRSGADPYDIWQSPDLFFAQTCGYPLTHRLTGKVRLLGSPCYDAPGCEGPMYRSLIIVRDGSKAETLAAALPARVAVNGMDSYSGWWALGATLMQLGLDKSSFSGVTVSGGHMNSVDLVREGQADLAAIDCVTFALARDVEPERLAGLKVLHQSDPAPGLPYITRAGMPDLDAVAMSEALEDAFTDPDLTHARRALRLDGFAHIPLAEYDRFMTKNLIA